MPLVNMKQRYVASAMCPIASAPECAALANRIFDHDAAASAALIEHLASGCHTREQLARVVGAGRGYTRSYRLVCENAVTDGLAA